MTWLDTMKKYDTWGSSTDDISTVDVPLPVFEAIMAVIEASNLALGALYSAHEAEPYLVGTKEADSLGLAIDALAKKVGE